MRVLGVKRGLSESTVRQGSSCPSCDGVHHLMVMPRLRARWIQALAEASWHSVEQIISASEPRCGRSDWPKSRSKAVVDCPKADGDGLASKCSSIQRAGYTRPGEALYVPISDGWALTKAAHWRQLFEYSARAAVLRGSPSPWSIGIPFMRSLALAMSFSIHLHH